MTEKQPPLVVVFPRGQLTPKDKERMTKHGILCVEADTPKDVVQLQLSAPMNLTSNLISGDAVVTAAFSAMTAFPPEAGGGITGAGRVMAEFVKLLAASVKGAAK